MSWFNCGPGGTCTLRMREPRPCTTSAPSTIGSSFVNLYAGPITCVPNTCGNASGNSGTCGSAGVVIIRPAPFFCATAIKGAKRSNPRRRREKNFME